MTATNLALEPSFLSDGKSHHRSFKPCRLVMPTPRILLVDDDPIFCCAFEKLASRYHVPVVTFDSFREFDNKPNWDYDMVLMDYNLGKLNGIQFAEYIEQTVGDVPLLLVSGTHRKKSAIEPWPKLIRGFSNKERGLEAVFDDAMRVFARAQSKISTNKTH